LPEKKHFSSFCVNLCWLADWLGHIFICATKQIQVLIATQLAISNEKNVNELSHQISVIFV
jgi:hypothetical protein